MNIEKSITVGKVKFLANDDGLTLLLGKKAILRLDFNDSYQLGRWLFEVFGEGKKLDKFPGTTEAVVPTVKGSDELAARKASSAQGPSVIGNKRAFDAGVPGAMVVEDLSGKIQGQTVSASIKK